MIICLFLIILHVFTTHATIIFKGDGLSSNDVREYLLAGNEHPSKLFPDCFSEDPPVAAITYEWRLSLADILSYLNPAQATPSPESGAASLRRVFLSFWGWF
jgi:hypothetical protein